MSMFGKKVEFWCALLYNLEHDHGVKQQDSNNFYTLIKISLKFVALVHKYGTGSYKLDLEKKSS